MHGLTACVSFPGFIYLNVLDFNWHFHVILVCVLMPILEALDVLCPFDILFIKKAIWAVWGGARVCVSECVCGLCMPSNFRHGHPYCQFCFILIFEIILK